MTINGDAPYARRARVVLHLALPAGTTAVHVSNDAGFSSAQTFPATRRIRWRLARGANGPRTVYVRLDAPGVNPDEALSDTIVLDSRRPVITSTRMRKSRAAVGKRAARRSFRLTVKARDAGSGVAGLQVTRRRSAPGTPTAYRQTIRLSVPFWQRFVQVRVIDAAGNVSTWHRVRLRANR